MTLPRRLPLRSAGDPVSDSRAFRSCLGQFATGVTVITTEVDGVAAGVTVNSFSSLSLDPPLVLWSISRSSRSCASFIKASGFAVNVLGVDQIEISQNFSGTKADKFSAVEWLRGESGMPLLEGVIATIECHVEAMHDGGDHILFIGRVRRFASFEGQVLLFKQGRYGIGQDHPGLRADRALPTVPSQDSQSQLPMLTLLQRAHHHMSRRFADHRKAEEVSRDQIRILVALARSSDFGTQSLANETYLTREAAEDALVDLLRRGLAEKSASGSFILTPEGWSVRESVRRRTSAFEAAELAGFSKENVETARRLLEWLSRSEYPD